MTISQVNNDFWWPESSPIWERCHSTLSKIPTEKIISYFNNFRRQQSKQVNLRATVYPMRELFSLAGSATENEDNEPIIRLGSLLLIDPRSIPEKFKVKDFNDPKLKDNAYLTECIQWINDEHFKIENLDPSDISERDRNTVKLFLVLASQPELFERMVEFTLAHETVHVVCDHGKEQEPLIDSLNTKIINDYLATLLMGALGFLIPQNAQFRILSCLLGGLFGYFIGGPAFSTFLNPGVLSIMKRFRNMEKEADLLAAKALGNIDGGIYLFKTCLQHDHYLFDQKSEEDKRNIKSINYFTKTHPTYEERIVYLEASKENEPVKELFYVPTVPSFPYQDRV